MQGVRHLVLRRGNLPCKKDENHLALLQLAAGLIAFKTRRAPHTAGYGVIAQAFEEVLP